MSETGGDAGVGQQIIEVANATGVPASIKSRAINWLGRFIAGSVLYPAVEQARENMDTVAGRSRVNMMLAEEVGRQAIADPEMIERAKARFIGEHFRKQENIESVAVLALEDLRQSNPDETLEKPVEPEVDEDWLNVFSRHAEDASSERMRQLFAHILSGEIRKPGSYSLSAMRFIAEMDRQTAEAFAELARYVVSDFVLRNERWEKDLGRTLALEDAGLISGAAGTLNKTSNFGETGGARILATGRSLGLVAMAPPNTSLSVPALILTRIARELVGLVESGDERANLLEVAEYAKTQGITKLYLGKIQPPPISGITHDELLWELPVP